MSLCSDEPRRRGLPFCALAALILLATAAARAGEAIQDAYPAHRTVASTASLLAVEFQAWDPAAAVRWGPSEYRTTLRALWHDEGLFVRFDAVDPTPWSTLTERDDHLWNEEVVEIFIDPDGDERNYAEIEISPANVVCDLLIGAGMPAFESDIDWDFDGLRTVVATLHDDHGAPVGWVAVAYLPWNGFGRLPAGDRLRLPPAPGDAWRFNAFRIKRPGGPDDPERGAVFAALSPVSGASFHEPSVFRPLVFVE